MGSASDVIELFLTDNAERARTLAARFHQLNQERQAEEAEIVRTILEECERFPVTDDQKALVFSGRNWHRGVVGIAASRLVDRFHRPAVVLSEDPETGLAQGSGRSIPAFHLLEALESMPELFVRFGGHRQAAGLTLSTERVAEFRQRLNDVAGSMLTDDDLTPTLDVDAGLELSEVDDAAVAEILTLAPFGFGNPAPVFAVCHAELVSAPVVWKDKHLLVRLTQGGRTLTAKGWNMAPRASELGLRSHADFALCFEEDRYSLRRGYAGWSAVVRDLRPVP
jgi:single-stranded-DNA-specific exonuclease